MKIGINAYVISQGPPGGFRTYTLNLIKHLSEIDSENEYIIYVNKNFPKDLFGTNFQIRVRPARNLLSWEQIALPKALKEDRPDIIHFPANTASIKYPGKGIMTIHDTNLFKTDLLRLHTHKSLKSKLLSRYHIYNIPYAAKNASIIITVSQQSKKDIMKNLKVPEKKIKVIYEAASNCYCPLKEKRENQKIRQRFNLNSRFILSLGSIDPRKNIKSIIRAFQRIESQIGDCQLVIVWPQKPFLKKSKDNWQSNKIIHLINVSNEDLAKLYNSAEVFVFPSLYEGFGLPPLEAMACGTPVITSNVSSLPEVVGDAALMVNPLDTDQLANAMYVVLKEPQLRKKMSIKGLEQARKFSWNKAALETLGIYKKVFSENKE